MVLRAIASAAILVLQKQPGTVKHGIFRTAGGKVYTGPVPVLEKEKLLPRADDWEIVWDEEFHQALFPPQICATSSRPDMVIYS